MGQLLLGLFVLASVFAAFWFIARLSPREAIYPSIPEGPPRAREPWELSPTDLILTIAGALGTALVLGMSIAAHRAPDTLVFSLNLAALVVLIVAQVWALHRRDGEFLKGSTVVAKWSGFFCTVRGLPPRRPLDWFQLATLTLLALVLLGSLWWGNRRRITVPT